MNKRGSRALVGALTVAMVAPSALAPVSQAVAADAPAIERVTVDTSFSNAAQRIIKGEGRMTAEELKAAIDEAAKALDAAKADAERAEGADARQATVVANAKGSYDGASAAASQADAAKVAELERQIEALNAELAAAQKKVEDLNKQSADASAALEGLEADKAEAEKSQTQAQTALDEANEALKEAQEALDALGENPTADEQAAYDAAKKAYDDAVADQQAKQQAADEAKAALDALNAELTSKQGELATAQGDLEAKQAAKQRADEVLATAKASYAATVEAIKGELIADEKAALEAATTEQAAAQAAYDAVKDGEDEGAIASAKAALDAANEKLASAQTAYDQAVATAGSQAEAEASAAIQEKQTAADNAAAALADCENKIATLPGQIEGIDTQIASEQQKVTEAQATVDDANELVSQKQEAFDIAAAALEDLAEAQRQWDEKAKPLQEAVKAAKQGVEAAEQTLTEAQSKVSDLESQIANVQKQIDEITGGIDQGTEAMMDDFVDFLEWYNAKFTTSSGKPVDINDGYLAHAYHLLTGTGGSLYEYELDDGTLLSDYTHVGKEGDATDLDNVKASLEIIQHTNELREAAGLKPIQISINLMVASMLQANWSASHIDHVQNHMGEENPYGFGIAENLAWGHADGKSAVDGWYSEKSIWEKFCAEKGWATTDATAWSVYTQHRSEVDNDTYFKVGHYLNLMNPDYIMTGAAVNTVPGSNRYGNTYGQVYDHNNVMYAASTTLGGRYNELVDLLFKGEFEFYPEDILALIDEAIRETAENGGASDETLQQLQAKLAELERQKAAAAGEVASAQSGVTSAKKTLTQADDALAAIGERPTGEGAQAAYDDALEALADAKKQQSEAQENLTNVTSEVNQKVEELTGQKSELEGQLDTAKGQLDDLRTASEEAARQLADTRAQYKSLTDAAKALDTCEANATEADNAYKTASALVKSLNSQITEFNGQIEAAQNDYDQKKAAAEAAGPTEKQAQALENAEAALAAKKQQVAQLERDRDAAKQTAEEAAAAKAEVDALVDAIMADIEEKTGIKQAAEAALPQAEAKADAWAAALPNADAVKDAVLNGGTSDDADVKAALDAAHLAYEEKAVLAEMAADRLADAKAAYEAALEDKDATAAELAEKKAALAEAQAAYDELVALLPEEKPEATPGEPEQGAEQGGMTQAGYDVAAPKATAEAAQSGDDLPQTGDAAGAMIAGLALAGMAAVGAGAHFRRRNQL